jgi:hypothetical protein
MTDDQNAGNPQNASNPGGSQETLDAKMRGIFQQMGDYLLNKEVPQPKLYKETPQTTPQMEYDKVLETAFRVLKSSMGDTLATAAVMYSLAEGEGMPENIQKGMYLTAAMMFGMSKIPKPDESKVYNVNGTAIKDVSALPPDLVSMIDQSAEYCWQKAGIYRAQERTQEPGPADIPKAG